jgi:hypothetical protein
MNRHYYGSLLHFRSSSRVELGHWHARYVVGRHEHAATLWRSTLAIV